VADTKKIEEKAERKKLKRAARKKAAPKAKRTTPRGSQKKKVKKLARPVETIKQPSAVSLQLSALSCHGQRYLYCLLITKKLKVDG
jgi:hypothetical protein